MNDYQRHQDATPPPANGRWSGLGLIAVYAIAVAAIGAVWYVLTQ